MSARQWYQLLIKLKPEDSRCCTPVSLIYYLFIYVLCNLWQNVNQLALKWLMNISLVNWFTFTFCLDFSIVLWGIILRLPKLASLKDTTDEYLVVLPTSTKAAIISLQSHSVWQRWQCQTFLSFFRDCLWIFNMRQLFCEDEYLSTSKDDYHM